MSQVNIRMDDDLKNRAEALFAELGMNLSTAFNVFIRQSLRCGGIPFEVTTISEPFYNERNLAYLRMVKADVDAGCPLAEHELTEVPDA